MFDDPIVEEVRRYRQEHAAKYGNDIHRIFEALREQEKNLRGRWFTSARASCPAASSPVSPEKRAKSTKPRTIDF